MKRFSLVMLLAIFCSLPAFSQFWIHVEWGAPHCRHCEWMEEAVCLSPREAAEYHRIIHKYGERIERDARKEYRYWDLIRWHKLDLLDNTTHPNILLGAKVTGAPVDILNVGGYVDATFGKVRKYEPRQYLFPIPSGQIALNPNLEQNKLWK